MLLTVVAMLAVETGATTRANGRDQTCAVGRVALHDLLVIDKAPARAERFYGGHSDPYHRDILDACPLLRDAIPSGFPIATDAAFVRSRDITTSEPVSIYDVGVPQFDGSGTRAIVDMGYYCSGLCGARFVVSYILTAHGWRRDGEPRVTSVS